jgi:lysyl-tRNA synthetase class 2
VPPREDLERLRRVRPALEARARALAAIRSFFRDRGFLEVETPARVACPGLEPHLRPFPAGAAADGVERWLITSPELHLKRMLCAGYPRLVEVARAFRDEESGRHHASEFTLLEWYRAGEDLAAIAGDLAALLPEVARAAGVDPARAVEGCDLTLPPRTQTYAAAFRAHAGVDPHGLLPEERDFRFVDRVEPRLGFERPLLLTEYPADACALARLVPAADPGEVPPPHLVAGRMELYVAGVELANAFDELTDPALQRQRHETDRAARRRLGTAVPPLDEAFLGALEAGMPAAAGVALGIDRLLMLVLGKRDVAEVRAFTE